MTGPEEERRIQTKGWVRVIVGIGLRDEREKETNEVRPCCTSMENVEGTGRNKVRRDTFGLMAIDRINTEASFRIYPPIYDRSVANTTRHCELCR